MCAGSYRCEGPLFPRDERSLFCRTCRKTIALIALCPLFFSVLTSPGIAETRPHLSDANVLSPSRQCVKGEILVKMKKNTSLRSIRASVPELGMGKARVISRSGLSRLMISENISEEEAARVLMEKAPESIEYAEPNYLLRIARFPDDPKFETLYSLHNTGQSGGIEGADIAAVEAWDILTGGDIVVAVIDSGVDYKHRDLADNIWANINEIPDNGIDDDENGFVDDYHGWDFFDKDNDPGDEHSHGTHCAGIIAAVGDNGVGVVGINWRAGIMPLKFICAEGWGTMGDAVCAIDYATAMGAKVISCSWGGDSYSHALKDAIEAANEAGVVFVAAAGNAGGNNDDLPFYPSSYDCENIISVAATDRNDSLASFSCWGPKSVDLAAPGDSVVSTLPGDLYGGKSGTSIAAPHVAGAAALIRAHKPTWSHTRTISAILEGVEPCSSLEGKVATGGRLNLLLMLDPDAARLPEPTPTPIPDPRFHAVTLELNGEDFRAGEDLYLSASVTYGWLCPHTFCDAYLAVSGPGVPLLFLSGTGEWSPTAVPFARSFHVVDMSAYIGSFSVPIDLPEGDYQWYAVLTPPQDNPLRSVGWASNLSQAPFTIVN